MTCDRFGQNEQYFGAPKFPKFQCAAQLFVGPKNLEIQ
jgi:hypothetical protein